MVDITREKQAVRSMSSFDAEIDARKRTRIVPLICVCLDTDPDGKAAGKGLRLAAPRTEEFNEPDRGGCAVEPVA